MHDSLPRRLHDSSPKARAQAVQEIGLFRVDEYLQAVVPLIKDPIPYVSHGAAHTLTQSQDLQFAQPVMDWVLGQELYQRDRLLRVLEGFGPELLPWMEMHLPPSTDAPEAWILFARLAGSHRHQPSEGRLLQLLAVPKVDLQASAIRALAGLADPAIYPHILPLAWSKAWPIRAQAARALGMLGGPGAIPDLLPLTADPVYEVRRNAAQGLADLGHAGIGALDWLAEDPEADRFARDIARERLEWSQERGHL
jgi:HEAT repeat protein